MLVKCITWYYTLQFTHDYVLYMDKLYVSLHVMRLKWTTQKIINILMY